MELSNERRIYNELTNQFKRLLPVGGLIYDIGKSQLLDYKSTFEGYKYLTVDRNRNIGADIIDDLEETKIVELADGVLCNGVMEQCTNPMAVLESIYKILKPMGHLLLGAMSIGYPMYEFDYQRFTPKGVNIVLLRRFETLETRIVARKGIPSYVFVIARKGRKNE